MFAFDLLRRMSFMRIAVTSYHLDNLTRRCILGLLDSGCKRILLCDNVPEESTRELSIAFAVDYRGTQRIALSALWNKICAEAFDAGERAVLILNNDTWHFRGIHALEMAVARNHHKYGVFFGIQQPERFYAPCPSWFSAFAMTSWCLEEVGPFDEGYWPCGWEDDDYMMRLAEKHIPTALVREFTFRHLSSPSSEIRDRQEKEKNDALNQSRFTARWGLRRLDKESQDFRFPGMAEI